MSFEQLKILFLICLVMHGIMSLADDWQKRPKQKENKNPSALAVWITLVVLWVAVHASPVVYYGSELIEKLWA